MQKLIFETKKMKFCVKIPNTREIIVQNIGQKKIYKVKLCFKIIQNVLMVY